MGDAGSDGCRPLPTTSLFETLRPEAVFEVAADGRIVRATPGSAPVLPTSPGASLGATCADLCRTVGPPPAANACAACAVQRAIREGIPGVVELAAFASADLVAAVYPLVPLLPGAAPTALLVVRQGSRVRDVERLRVEFLSSVSREMRTPVAAIKGFAKTLRRDPAISGAHRDEFLGIIERECDQLRALVDDLLQVARLSANPTAAAGRVEDLALVLLHVRADVAPRYKEKGVRLVWEDPPGPVRVPLEPRQMARAFIQILDALLRLADSTVSVGVEVAPGHSVVRFHATGGGLDAPVGLDKLSPARRFRPGGAGLFVARRIVECHGGSLTVTSAACAGTTVEVRLPLVDTEE